MLSALELTPIMLFSNRNNGEPNVNLHSSNNGDTNDAHESHHLSKEINSTCSTPYISAPSNPGRGCPAIGYFSSAPASPMHYELSTASRSDSFLSIEFGSFKFEFSFGFSPSGMSSADELFLNGQIQLMSPLQTAQFQWQEHEENEASHHHHHYRILELEDSKNKESETSSIETTSSDSTSSSRSSSSGRNSKKWIFFKDLLYRSKSECRGNKKKLWSSIMFTCSSSSRDKKEKNHKETKMQKKREAYKFSQKNRSPENQRTASESVSFCRRLMSCITLRIEYRQRR